WAEMARLHERDGANVAALATWERILCAAPSDAAALEALTRLYGAERAGVARTALEPAIARSDESTRFDLVRRTLLLIPAGDAIERLPTLRRLLALAPATRKTAGDVIAAAIETKALGSIVSVFEELAAASTDLETRHAHHQRLAALYQEAGE